VPVRDVIITLSTWRWGADNHVVGAWGGVCEMFEWCISVSCPVQPLSGSEQFQRRIEFERRLYVWTPAMCASDAYNEGLRILTGWPPGTKLVSIVPVGVYRWMEGLVVSS
jgi:hypothetical protein